MIHKKLRLPLFFISLSAVVTGCGSTPHPSSTANDTSEASKSIVEGLGLSFQISQNNRLSTAQMNYDGAKTILVNVAAGQEEPESEIWVTTFPCEHASLNKEKFQDFLAEKAQDLLADGLANGGFKIASTPDAALQLVPKTADRFSIFGFYFDFVRTYHSDRAERLVVLGDFLNGDQKCIRLKAGSEKSELINPTTLLGKTLIEVQSTIRWNANNSTNM